MQGSSAWRPAKGLASRVGNWVSGGGGEDGSCDVDPAEMIQPQANLPYLSWVVMDMEMRKQAPLWSQLAIQLAGQTNKSFDQVKYFPHHYPNLINFIEIS